MQVAKVIVYLHMYTGSHKIRKEAKIRNRYKLVPHLTRNTIWESDNNTIKHHTQESQKASPFLVGDRKDKHETKILKKDPQKECHLGITSKTLIEGLIMFNGTNLTLNSNLDQDI